MRSQHRILCDSPSSAPAQGAPWQREGSGKAQVWGDLPPTCDLEEPLSCPPCPASLSSPLPYFRICPCFPSPLPPLACPPPAQRSSSLKGRGHFPELSSSPTGPSTQLLEASWSLVFGIHNRDNLGGGGNRVFPEPSRDLESLLPGCLCWGSSGPPENTTYIVYRGWTCTDHTCFGYLKAALAHGSRNQWKQPKCLTMDE